MATGGRKIEGMVIPTSAMNAFALMDFEGRSVIGVTEGLLARLTRAQLEAVVGHEAAHIVSGDCLATTVTTSLFALYSGLLKGLESVFRATRSSSRRGGGVLALLIAVYVLLWISRGMSHLARMFVSRQREYRADAIAARLTRDPLSPAEALYTIAYRWRGAGLAAEELESIFMSIRRIPPLMKRQGCSRICFPPIHHFRGDYKSCWIWPTRIWKESAKT